VVGCGAAGCRRPVGADPLRVVGEVTDWARLTPEALQQWKDRIAVINAERGEIIN
jgi:rifampin ADP-ribosylating transferase